jgi:isopentenyldiphosphate isomerase
LSDADELLPVVDDNDVVQGVRRRGDIHALGLPHRAVHVLVFDAQGRLFLQLRSNNKDTHPGKWTTSACGHVDPDEDYAEAASRELQEELGLELALDGGGLHRGLRAHGKRIHQGLPRSHQPRAPPQSSGNQRRPLV